VYAILAAGKPIVAVAPRGTDVAAIGEKQGFAVWGDPADPEQVACAVRQMLRDGNQIRQMSEAAQAAANEYDRVSELRKFLRIIEEARPA
jgi:glycosyltransferase involved in cell wall biosynthesis